MNAFCILLFTFAAVAQEVPSPAPAPTTEDEFNRAALFGRKFADDGFDVSGGEPVRNCGDGDGLAGEHSVLCESRVVRGCEGAGH